MPGPAVEAESPHTNPLVRLVSEPFVSRRSYRPIERWKEVEQMVGRSDSIPQDRDEHKNPKGNEAGSTATTIIDVIV